MYSLGEIPISEGPFRIYAHTPHYAASEARHASHARFLGVSPLGWTRAALIPPSPGFVMGA